MGRTSIVALLCCLLSAVAADASRGGSAHRLKNNLISLVTPSPGHPASAHPFVNVIVLFGALVDGTPADPTSFRARIGHDDVTGLFAPVTNASGVQTGARAMLDPSHVKLGHRPRNTLRLTILTKKPRKGPRFRDVDRVRFAAVEQDNRPCTANAGADSQVVIPGIAVHFASAGTSDPDRDELTYAWSFGDGATASESDPTHVYEVQGTSTVTATLTATDPGGLQCTEDVVLEAIPALPDGATPGALFVQASDKLEYGGVAIGASATKTLTLKNTDATPGTMVAVRLGTTNGAFVPSETSLLLGPDESHDITLTFTPSATGHQSARVALVANASNRNAVSFLAHGYGGSAPDNGPTLAADPVFFTDPLSGFQGLGIFGYMPDGRKFFVDNGVHTCQVPSNGFGSGDFCLTDADCAANGGTCQQTSTCASGPNAGQPCSVHPDCPLSFCPSFASFDPVDLCSDGKSVYLISDDGTFTEPDPNAETERAVSIMRIDLAPDGSATNKLILARTTTETAHIACDGFPASQGGQVYIPEFHNVPDDGNCFRSEREALVKIAKSNGTTQTIASRIDAYEGLGDCDDLDPVQQLDVVPDGSKTFAAFESGGLWQIRPTPIFFTPDLIDIFQVHPDGTVLFATTTDAGSTGRVNLYRVTAAQVQHGALPISALVPCASFEVPNNGGRTIVVGFSAARAAANSTDGTALVSFISSGPGISSTVSPTLFVRGTVAFTASAGTTTCTAAGIVNLEPLELAF